MHWAQSQRLKATVYRKIKFLPVEVLWLFLLLYFLLMFFEFPQVPPCPPSQGDRTCCFWKWPALCIYSIKKPLLLKSMSTSYTTLLPIGCPCRLLWPAPEIANPSMLAVALDLRRHGYNNNEYAAKVVDHRKLTGVSRVKVLCFIDPSLSLTPATARQYSTYCFAPGIIKKKKARLNSCNFIKAFIYFYENASYL